MKPNSSSSILRLVACIALVLLAASAFAEDVKDTTNEGPMDPIISANCDLTNYKVEIQTFSPPRTVTDNNATGTTFGPIVLAGDGLLIADVVIDIDWAHTWIGDVIARVDYDENNDTVIDASSTIVCRPGRTVSCGPSGTGVGCSSNFTTGAIYNFDDTAAASLPTAGCVSTTNIPGGCYLPTGLGATPLSAFEGRLKGGKWYLFISDNAAGDVLTLTRWSVHIFNDIPVSVEPTSWGNLKVLYN